MRSSSSVSGARWFDAIGRDVIFGWRSLRRAPALLAVALLSLGLGTGVNLTIFSLLDAALLRDVTAQRPDRLVRLRVGPANQVSHPDYRDLRAALRGGGGAVNAGRPDVPRHDADGPFADLAGLAHTRLQWASGDRVESLFAQVVTPNFFDLLGARAQLGRLLTEAEASASPAFASLAPIEIVGVVRDSKYDSLGEAAQPMLYRPFAQPLAIRRQAVLSVRAAGSPECDPSRGRTGDRQERAVGHRHGDAAARHGRRLAAAGTRGEPDARHGRRPRPAARHRRAGRRPAAGTARRASGSASHAARGMRHDRRDPAPATFAPFVISSSSLAVRH